MPLERTGLAWKNLGKIFSEISEFSNSPLSEFIICILIQHLVNDHVKIPWVHEILWSFQIRNKECLKIVNFTFSMKDHSNYVTPSFTFLLPLFSTEAEFRQSPRFCLLVPPVIVLIQYPGNRLVASPLGTKKFSK